MSKISITATLTHLPDQYQDSRKRVNKAWQRCDNKAFENLKAWQRKDALLADYRVVNSPLTRALIRSARHFEEIGEMSSELSNQTERVVNHLIHPSDRFNTTQVFAAAVGRVSTIPLKVGGLRWHKLIGGTSLALSSLLSIAALAANGGGLTERQYGRLKALQAQGIEKPKSLISDYGKFCVKTRNRNIDKVDRWIDSSAPDSHPVWNTVKTKLLRLRETPNKPLKENYRRMGHIGYMSEHLYQYDKTTRALHKTAFLIYKVCNKTIPSFDKHIGQLMARGAKHQIGFLLANRVLLACTAIGWGVIAPIFLPLEISLTMIGVSACGIAMVLLAMAKISAHSGGWRGDLLEPI